MNNLKINSKKETTIRNILILGGYGRTGTEIAKQLIEHTECKITIAGRSIEKAMETANKLNSNLSNEGNNRVKGLMLDAGNVEILTETLKNYDLLIVSMPISSVGDKIVKAAVNAGINYIDLNLNEEKQKTLKSLSGKITESGLTFISESGFLPGTPAFLTRLLNEMIATLREVEITVIFKEKEVTYGSCLDFIEALGTDAYLFEDGKWSKSSIWKSIRCDFGNELGEHACYPMRMIELEKLAEDLHLKKCGLYAAGINAKADLILFIWKIFKLYRTKRGVNTGARLLYRATKNKINPPYITLLKATGIGQTNGIWEKISVSLSHPDGYIATAIPIVACVLQLQDGTINQPGVFTMGEVVNVHRFKKNIAEFGIEVDVLETPL